MDVQHQTLSDQHDIIQDTLDRIDPITTLLQQNMVGPFGYAHIRKSLTFSGAAGSGASGDVITIFKVTGSVILRNLVPVCTVALTQSGATPTLALGVTGVGTSFIAATTATAITAINNIWQDATPTPVVEAAVAAMTNVILATNTAALAIIATVGGTANINGGVLVFDAWYTPITDNGALT